MEAQELLPSDLPLLGAHPVVGRCNRSVLLLIGAYLAGLLDDHAIAWGNDLIAALLLLLGADLIAGHHQAIILIDDHDIGRWDHDNVSLRHDHSIARGHQTGGLIGRDSASLLRADLVPTLGLGLTYGWQRQGQNACQHPVQMGLEVRFHKAGVGLT